jgi:hypothetical protein
MQKVRVKYEIQYVDYIGHASSKTPPPRREPKKLANFTQCCQHRANNFPSDRPKNSAAEAHLKPLNELKLKGH